MRAGEGKGEGEGVGADAGRRARTAWPRCRHKHAPVLAHERQPQTTQLHPAQRERLRPALGRGMQGSAGERVREGQVCGGQRVAGGHQRLQQRARMRALQPPRPRASSLVASSLVRSGFFVGAQRAGAGARQCMQRSRVGQALPARATTRPRACAAARVTMQGRAEWLPTAACGGTVAAAAAAASATRTRIRTCTDSTAMSPDASLSSSPAAHSAAPKRSSKARAIHAASLVIVPPPEAM